MLENTTVKLALEDFDELRSAHKYHEQLKRDIRDCFDYSCEAAPHPSECEICEHAALRSAYPNHREQNERHTDLFIYCKSCDAFNNHSEFIEKITVNIDRLIETTKIYALYGRDIEVDLDEVHMVLNSKAHAEKYHGD